MGQYKELFGRKMYANGELGNELEKGSIYCQISAKWFYDWLKIA